MPKKIKSVRVANTTITIRDIWSLANNAEQYIITTVSNTLIGAYTLGEWTDKLTNTHQGTEYWPAEFTIAGWEYYVNKLGMVKTGVLDPSIKI